MSDPFDSELAALRKEVGEFVLEVLRADGEHVADRIADGLTERLAQNLRTVTALNPRELAAVEGLRDALRDIPADERRAAISRSAAARQVAETSSRSQDFDEGEPDNRPDATPQDGLKVWRIAAVSSIAFALIVLVGAIAFGGAFRREPALAATGAPPAVEDTSGAADGDGWTRVMASSRALQPDAAQRDLTVLCGRPLATGCSLQEAEAHWAQNPQAAREAAAIIERVLTTEGVCRTQLQGQTRQEAQARLVSCLLERPLS